MKLCNPEELLERLLAKPRLGLWRKGKVEVVLIKDVDLGEIVIKPGFGENSHSIQIKDKRTNRKVWLNISLNELTELVEAIIRVTGNGAN